jgi:hypothetical protein
MNDKKEYMIQCKVSREVYERLQKKVEEGRMKSIYELLQYLVSSFLKVADTDVELDKVSEDLYVFAIMFEGWMNEKNRVVTAKPSGNKELKMTDSINIFSEKGKKGHVCKIIKVNGSEIKTNGSIIAALDILLKKLFPSTYCKMIDIGKNIGEDSVLNVIEYMIEEAAKKGLTEKVNPFSPVYNSNEYGNVPKRKRKKSINDE